MITLLRIQNGFGLSLEDPLKRRPLFPLGLLHGALHGAQALRHLRLRDGGGEGAERAPRAQGERQRDPGAAAPGRLEPHLRTPVNNFE